MTNTASREIRVFLSSTFRDMEIERAHLVKQVFPRVRAACLARQVGFTDIDLRWGVTEEESKNGATVEICLQEIDRCREFPPFFIGFLGERYGWVPRDSELDVYWQRNPGSAYAQRIRDAVARGISVTELEMELAVFGSPDGRSAFSPCDLGDHALFLLRDPGLTDALRLAAGLGGGDTTAYSDDKIGELDILKRRVRDSGVPVLDGYTTIEQFGNFIERHLLNALDRYFPLGLAPTAQERSNAAHAAFRFSRLQNFLPRIDVRNELLTAIEARILHRCHGPILLAGPGGHGKSAVLADLARYLEDGPEAGSQLYRVIDHYIGADEQNTLEAWAWRVLQCIHPYVSDLVGPLPPASPTCVQHVPVWAALAARREEGRRRDAGMQFVPVRYVLLLDALDQLSDEGSDLLPILGLTSADCILVVSAADSTAAAQSAASFQTVRVPPLGGAIRKSIIRETLSRFRKNLQARDVVRLAASRQCGSPLFLALSLEKLRIDAHHDTLSSLIDQILGAPSAEELFLGNFLRDPEFSRAGQTDQAALFIALLGATRAGLAMSDLADLLAIDGDPVAPDTGRPRMPQAFLSQLFAIFGGFLVSRGGRWGVMHRILGEVALRHCGEVGVRRKLHEYFRPGYGPGDLEFVPRYAGEAVFQLVQLGGHRPAEDSSATDRLEKDMGSLWIPANLFQFDPQVTLAALHSLDDAGRLRVAAGWVSELAEFDLGASNLFLHGIRGFVVWMRQVACDRYRLPALLGEALLSMQLRVGDDAAETVALTLHEIGLTYYAKGDYPAAVACIERAVPKFVAALGVGHAHVVGCQSALAACLAKSGTQADLLKGISTLRAGIMALKSAGSASAEDIADVSNTLSVLLMQTGARDDATEARLLLRQVLAAREEACGKDHPSVATSLNNLAMSLKESGARDDLDVACDLLRRALVIVENCLGKEHPNAAMFSANLADVLSLAGGRENIEAAGSLHEHSISIREKALGALHPETAKGLAAYAGFLHEHGGPGSFVKVRPLFERALDSLKVTHGVAHPEAAVVAGNFAKFLASTGNHDDLDRAIRFCQDAIALHAEFAAGEHPHAATGMVNLSGYLCTRRSLGGSEEDIASAIALAERAISIFENALGSSHPYVASARSALASCLRQRGHDDDKPRIRSLLESVLESRRVSLGEDHPDTAVAMNNLACCVGKSGNADDLALARSLYTRSVDLFERLHGPDHPVTASGLANLAASMDVGGSAQDVEAVRRYYLRALAIREGYLGAEHEQCVEILYSLVHGLRHSGNLDEAVLWMREILARRSRYPGEESCEAADAHAILGEMMALLGDLDSACAHLSSAVGILTRLLGVDHERTVSARQKLLVLRS